ncbi:hypothetical protein BC835DRAFT_1234297, partial [Cytidiella melzeri]
MTRTERAIFPRAIARDRSESKTGIDKRTPKNGAGPHNWGSLEDERDLEEQAAFDEQSDTENTENTEAIQPPQPRRKSSPALSEQEKGQALQFRKNALKSPDVDLGAIARSSAAVSS